MTPQVLTDLALIVLISTLAAVGLELLARSMWWLLLKFPRRNP